MITFFYILKFKQLLGMRLRRCEPYQIYKEKSFCKTRSRNNYAANITTFQHIILKTNIV